MKIVISCSPSEARVIFASLSNLSDCAAVKINAIKCDSIFDSQPPEILLNFLKDKKISMLHSSQFKIFPSKFRSASVARDALQNLEAKGFVEQISPSEWVIK